MKGKNLSIEIKHPEGSLEYLVGWIYVTFKTRDAEITVHVSDVFNPAFEIAYLFYGLIQGSIPQLIEVDEEGEIKVIRILPYEDDQVRFQIEDYNYGEGDYGDTGYPRMHMDIILNKKELIEEFESIPFSVENFEVAPTHYAASLMLSRRCFMAALSNGNHL